ncbi:MAG TPA: ROK family protein [Roseiflexaceae bacterium]|nr:ROK family protein [Roseiflexaceae bacterium]
MRYIIGVDLGGTNLRVALADEAGGIVREVRRPTTADEGPPAVIDKIVAGIDEVRAALPDGSMLLGVGIGSPGPLDPFNGVVFNMPNLPGWEHVPLRAILTERTDLSVELGNDANAAALGEWMFGKGKGLRNMVYVTISTGIGGGVIADGRLLLGHHGAAAEVGHHLIDSTTRASWEDLASGTALGRAAATAMRADPDTMLHRLATPETINAGDVARAAAAGDRIAAELMDREGDLIGVGLVNILNLYSPALIVLGGGVAINNPQLLDRARHVIQQRAFEVYRSVPIELASLGDRVGLLGAVALFLHMREGRV